MGIAALLGIAKFANNLNGIIGVSAKVYGENPGYYEQWLREKSPVSGEFPHWSHNFWNKWDKNRLHSRANHTLIDTVYQLGPKDIGGRTRSIWIDPKNENNILAAAISGGMWRSEDMGNTWLPLNDQESSLMASAITSDPFDPNLVYYGTGEGRANSADVDGNGVFKSSDGGKTFRQLASTVGLKGFETIWDMEHSKTKSNMVYVGTQTNGLWRTKNGGDTWEQVFNGGNSEVNDILTLPNGRVLISMQSNLVYASDSNGDPGTFSPVSFPNFPNAGQYRRIQMASCAAHPQVVYALIESFGFSDSALAFYKSRDYGKNWEKMPRPSGIGASYQGYCIMLGVHPTDSSKIIAGGVTIAQSDDGGKSWHRKKTGHSDHHAYVHFPTSTTDFLIGTDGGVFRYNWTDTPFVANLNNGYYVTQFYAGNFGPFGAVSIGGTQDNGSHVATGILTSKKFFGSDGGYAHIGLQDGTVAYLSTQNSGIRRIRNFNPAVPPPNNQIAKINAPEFDQDKVDFINAYAINPADQEQLYYRTNRFLYRSTNGGDNWNKISNIHLGMKAIGVSSEVNPIVYFGGSSAQLYKIENAANAAQGAEIVYNTSVPLAITEDFLNAISVNPKDKYTIYLAFSNYSNNPRIWRATGMNGNNPVFTNISGDLPPGLPVNFIVTDPNYPDKNYFAATDFGLYCSADSGKTWSKETRIPNVAIHELKLRADGILFLYTHGRGLWAVQLKGASALFHSGPDIQMYPNPADDILTVSLSTFPENAQVTIYNAIGEKVLDKVYASLKTSLDISQLRSGYYFVVITTNNSKVTKKLLVR